MSMQSHLARPLAGRPAEFANAVAGRNQLLSALPPDDFAALAPHIAEVTLDKGSVVQEAGEPIKRVTFPHCGLISILVAVPDGHEIEAVSIGREGAVGLTAGLGEQIAHARAVVQFPVLAAQIAVSRLDELAPRNKPIRLMIARYNHALLAQVQQLAACARVHHVQQRLCCWLLQARDRLGDDIVPITQEMLADLLGVQRTTVTMIGRLLQGQQIIQVRRGRIQIRSPAALEAKACTCYRIGRTLSEGVRSARYGIDPG